MKEIIKLEKIDRVEIFQNTKRYYKEKIKKITGCDYILNGAFFSGSYKPLQTLKVNDKLVVEDKVYKYLGYGWNTVSDFQLTKDYSNFKNFICCINGLQNGENCTMYYNADVRGKRPRTAIGLTKDSLVLYCDKMGKTPEDVRDILKTMGCLSMVCLDGGGSTQGNFNGKRVDSSENRNNGRICYSYILVYLKKDNGIQEKPTSPSKPNGEIKLGFYKVEANLLNIRNGAGSNYNKVGTYKKGEIISIISITNGWGKTDKGYVSIKYVTLLTEKPNTPPVTVPPQTTPDNDIRPTRASYTVTASTLNIRSGAGSKYAKVGTYNKGVVVEVLSIINGWGKTNKGWVSMDYLKKIPEKVSDTEKDGDTASTESTQTLRDKLINFAKNEIGNTEKNKGDDKYIKWYNQTMNTKLSMSVSWCCIWVSYCVRHVGIPKELILNSASCTASVNWFKKNKTWKDNNKGYMPQKGDLIFFNTDGNENNSEHIGIVTKIDSTKVYTIEGNSSDSVKENSYLLSSNKILGYANWDNSEKIKEEIIATGIVTASVLNVRQKANTNSEIISQLQKGAKVNIYKTIGVTSKWHKIDNGYISARYVKLD